MTDREPSPELKTAMEQDRLMQFFSYSHLPSDLGQISKPFCDLALLLIESLPRNLERTVALRKLLEAKDCAVRAMISIGY